MTNDNFKPKSREIHAFLLHACNMLFIAQNSTKRSAIVTVLMPKNLYMLKVLQSACGFVALIYTCPFFLIFPPSGIRVVQLFSKTLQVCYQNLHRPIALLAQEFLR